jgi:hypothetical protein
MGRELMHNALLDRLHEQTRALETKLAQLPSEQVRDALQKELEDLRCLAKVLAPGESETASLVTCAVGVAVSEPDRLFHPAD